MPHFNIGVWYNNVKKHGFYFLVSNKNLHIYIFDIGVWPYRTLWNQCTIMISKSLTSVCETYVICHSKRNKKKHQSIAWCVFV